jgi:hypothetical protein
VLRGVVNHQRIVACKRSVVHASSAPLILGALCLMHARVRSGLPQRTIVPICARAPFRWRLLPTQEVRPSVTTLFPVAAAELLEADRLATGPDPAPDLDLAPACSGT